MKPFMLLIDENKLKVLDTLITAAGKSPATDGNMMLLATDALRWIKASMEQAAAEAAAAAEKAANGGPKKEAPVIEAEAVQ